MRKRIRCDATLDLIDAIIEGANAQEPVHVHYPGDDLLTPLERRRGIPIGNLTSQFFANLYLDPLDHFCTEVLRAPYVRYVDDFALFHDDPDVLAAWREKIAAFLAGAQSGPRALRCHALRADTGSARLRRACGAERRAPTRDALRKKPARAPAVQIGRRLSLHPEKTFIAPTGEPAAFLGFVLHAGGKRALDEDNVRRFKAKLRGMTAALHAGSVTRDQITRRIDAWAAHADHAHARGMKRAILDRAAKAMRARPERLFARTA